MPDYGHEIEFGYFLSPDAGDLDGVLETARLADRLGYDLLAVLEIDSKVMLLPTAERGFQLAVELDVTLPSVAEEHRAVDLVRAAHRVCPYSNATRGNIEVKLTANKAPVAAA